MTKELTIDDLMKVLQAGIASVAATKAAAEVIAGDDDDDTPAGFIIIKKENHTKQVFFSDHTPVDGVDNFGHSTKSKERLVSEAYKYATYDEAYKALFRMIGANCTELNNGDITTLGIYDVEDDEIVFSLDISNPNNNTDRGDLGID